MDSNIYDEATQILHNNFDTHTNIAESQAKSDKALLKLLQKNPNDENDVRLAIMHFYHQCGLDCLINYDKKTLNVITHIQNRTHNIYIDRISQFLNECKITPNENLDKNARADSVLSEEHLDKVLEFVDKELNLTQELVKMEVIKNAWRNVFGIAPRDGLFFKNGIMLYSKFDEEIVKINNEIRTINQKAHINMLNSEDEQKLDFILTKGDIQGTILHNTINILQNDMLLSKNISNFTFNRNFMFFEIQKMRLYMESIGKNSHTELENIDSMAKSIYCMNLIWRFNWIIYEAVAKELLDLCMQNNKNALDFVGFYNGAPVKLRNKTFTKPIIIDRDGNPWTLVQIKECLRYKMNIEFDINAMQEQAQNLQEQIQDIRSQIKKALEEKQAYNLKEDTYQELIIEHNKNLRTLVDKNMPREQIEQLSNKLNMLIDDKSNVINKIDSLQQTLHSLYTKQNALLEQQDEIKERISYTLKSNKMRFLQYDLLLLAVAEAIRSGKDIV